MRAAVLVVSALAGLAIAAPARSAEIAWRVEQAPFRLSYLADGKQLTQEAVDGPPGPTRRLSYELADGTRHSLTDLVMANEGTSRAEYLVATTEPGRMAHVTVERTERGLRTELTLDPGAAVARMSEALTADAYNNERFMGTGARTLADLTGKAVQLKVSHLCSDYAVTPFYISSHGYGLYVDSPALGVMAFLADHPSFQYVCDAWGVPAPTVAHPGLVQISLNTSQLAYEVYTGDPKQVLAAYTAAVGRPTLPPPERFALVQWRDQVAWFGNIVDDVALLQSRDIPVGAVILDNIWEANACQGALAFGPELGDPAVLFSGLAARNVDLIVWISPLVEKRCGLQGYPADGLIEAGPHHWIVDFTHPGATAVFQRKLRALLRHPIAGLKVDRGDEVRLPPAEHNLYPKRFAEAVAEVVGPQHTTLFRSGFAGSQALVGALWAGDQRHTWDGLKDALQLGLSAGVSGFPIWGSDVGGYANEPGDPELTAELFLRWAQLGALSPVFEVGGRGRNATFWEFGQETVDLFRRSAVLHYELFPYHYELARRASLTGAPILRPLAFEHPLDGEAWYRWDHLMVGPNLLARIVTAPTGTAATRPQRVWLPHGAWVDVFTGEPISGRGWITRWTSLADFPLYLRRGRAIPFNFRSPRVFADDWAVNDLERRDRLTWLYAPSVATSTLTSHFGSTFKARQREKRVSITLQKARAETAVKLLGISAPCRVEIDGTPARRTDDLTGTTRGWRWEPARNELVVKRTGAAGVVRIAVTLC